MDSISLVSIQHDDKKVSFPEYSEERAQKVQRFHASFEEYTQTPLRKLDCLSEKLGVKGIFVKDESYRFGLNAFKVLGGSYALGHLLADISGTNIAELTFDDLISQEMKEKTGDITFITATDGNHGRGVAWTANRLGRRAVVYMPKGTVAERLNNIRKLGADASITPWNYDRTVQQAEMDAKANGWVLTQDTAWDGYEKVPGYIMQGYLTMAYEAVKQLGDVKPTHVFLQAGVGSMAAAVAAFIAEYYGEDRPVITIVEPHNANCLYETAKASDGKLHSVGGDLETIMAGLACGSPCTLAWDILKECADHFISMPDYVAANGMRILGHPCGTDEKIVSGESGASTSGLAFELLRNPEYDAIKQKIGLDANSVILCISTEGDTDKKNYEAIVWDGKYGR